MAERDVTTIALIGAAAVAGVGLYLWSKGPPGVNPGDTVYGDFTFDYLGQGGSYILLVRFGWWKTIPIIGTEFFDPEETMGEHTMTISLLEPDSYEYTLDIVIPDGARPGAYDAEGSILSPGMTPGLDYIIRAKQKSAINILEI